MKVPIDMDAAEQCPPPRRQTGFIFSGHAAGGRARGGGQGHRELSPGHSGDTAAASNAQSRILGDPQYMAELGMTAKPAEQWGHAVTNPSPAGTATSEPPPRGFSPIPSLFSSGDRHETVKSF